MDSIWTNYRELVSLAQLYLLREFTPSSLTAMAAPEFTFFQSDSTPTLSTLIPTTKNHSPTLDRTQSSYQNPTPQPLPPTAPPIIQNQTKVQAPVRPQHPSSPSAPPPQSLDDAPSLPQEKKIELQFVPLPPPLDLEVIKRDYSLMFQHVRIAETIPDDAESLKLKDAWKKEEQIPPVVIISFCHGKKELAFLKNFSHAISLRLAEARVIEASQFDLEKKWNLLLQASHLRLIIASDYGLYSHPELMKVYREAPQEGRHYLNSTPLLLLSDPSLYLKEPQCKSLLWRAICNEFASQDIPSSGQ